LRAGRDGDARRLFDSGAGKRRIDHVRALVAQMSAAERQRLRVEQDRLQSWSVAGLSAVGLGVLLVIATTAMVRRRLQAWVVRPVVELAGAARGFGEGDLSRRARVGGVAETVSAATTFNAMADRIEEMIVRLRELDELKTSFVASVSHELRTPLTSMKGFIGELTDDDGDPLTGGQREMLAIVERNTTQLEALVDDVLLLARLEARHLPLAHERVDLAGVLADLCEEMRPLVRERELALEIDVAGAGSVIGDRARLRQTFANLLSNAIKFSPPGGRVEVHAADADAGVLVEVADEGPGIPTDELARISERFFRASTARDVKGTGLGLTISREIAELHGGRLEVRSTVGVGSQFRVHLPRDDASARAAASSRDGQATGGR
jgi:signal transduction histidine kinase